MTVTTAIDITAEEQDQLKGKAADMLSQAQGMTITTEMENSQAATFTASLKAELKRRKALLAPTKAALDASKAAYNGLVAQIVTPLEEITELIGGKIGVFVKAENLRRQELQRIEDEKAAAAQRKEDERIARLNEKAAAANKPPPAIAPRYIAPARVVATVSAPAGTSYSTRWSAKVVDIKAVCLAVYECRLPEHAVAAAMPYFNALAVARKAEGELAPGVVAVSTVGPTQRTY